MLLLSARICQGRVITVDDDGVADFNNIQAAIDDANDGDTVEVQPGTYTGDGNRDIDFGGKAITVRSTDPNDPCIVAATIIDCNGTKTEMHRGFYFHSGEDANSVLEGFTITNGYASGSFPDDRGGAIYCDNSSPYIANCVIIGNSANVTGGGIGCRDTSYPVISNCLFEDNSAGGFGGGIYISYHSGSRINKCIFKNNSAEDGGGIVILTFSGALITNSSFIGNNANKEGGAIYNVDAGGEYLINCIISGNFAGGSGGGVCSNSSVIINCTITGNSAGQGGGLACLSGPIINSIIYGNQGGQIYPPDDIYISVAYSNIQGGWPWSGLGNIDVDPCFVEAGYWDVNGTPGDVNDDFWVDGDYHLKSEGWRWDADANEWAWDEVTSRCIDAGNPGCSPGSEPLPHSDNRINMGAYGGTAEASIPPHNWAILGDLNNDGTINFEDYAFQAIDWEKTEECQPGDLNRDGSIDMNDIALLREGWLELTSWH